MKQLCLTRDAFVMIFDLRFGCCVQADRSALSAQTDHLQPPQVIGVCEYPALTSKGTSDVSGVNLSAEDINPGWPSALALTFC